MALLKTKMWKSERKEIFNGGNQSKPEQIHVELCQEHHYETANVKIWSEPPSSTTYASPAGPARPPGRQRKSWRGWSRSTPRRADLRLGRTPHASHPGTSSACWPMRRMQELPNRWWGKPETPKEEQEQCELFKRKVEQLLKIPGPLWKRH